VKERLLPHWKVKSKSVVHHNVVCHAYREGLKTQYDIQYIQNRLPHF
jgi:hypothetical protein